MNWDILTYGNGEFLILTFNAVASIFGNGDYGTALNIAGLLGFIAVFIKAAFDREGIHSFSWLLGMLVLYLALIVPKANVIITDRQALANSGVVANVPLGLAMSAGAMSQVSDWITTSFQTVFTLGPKSDLDSGQLNGLSMVDRVLRISIPDGRNYNNFIEFFNSCVVIDGVGNNRFSWDDVLTSTNLSTFFSGGVAQNAASFLYVPVAGVSSIVPCRSGYVNSLLPDLKTAYVEALSKASTDLISVAGTQPAAAQKMQDDVQAVILTMTQVNQSPELLTVQAMQVNAIGDSLVHIASEVDADSFLRGFILNKAESERSASFTATAHIAVQKLPMLHNLFETFIYAVFPIIALMAIISPVKVSLGYLKVLVWISLWSPLLAVLHFAVTYHTAANLIGTLQLFQLGFSVISSSELIPILSEDAQTAGYLFLSIPMISWLFVSQGGALLAGVGGRVLAGYDSSVQSAAHEATAGSGQLHGTGFQQTASGGVLISNYDGHGNQNTFTNDGVSTQFNASDAQHISSDLVKQNVSAVQNQFTDSSKDTFMQARELSASNSAVLSSSNDVVLSAQNSTTSNTSATQSAIQSYQDTVNSTANGLRDFAKTKGVAFSDEAMVAIKGGTPLADVLNFGVTAEGKTISKESDQYAELAKYTVSNAYTQGISQAGQIAQSLATGEGSSVNQQQSDKLNSSLIDQETDKSSYSASSTRTADLQATLSNAESVSDLLKQGGVDRLKPVADAHGWSDTQWNDTVSLANKGDGNAFKDLVTLFDDSASANPNSNLNDNYENRVTTLNADFNRSHPGYGENGNDVANAFLQNNEQVAVQREGAGTTTVEDNIVRAKERKVDDPEDLINHSTTTAKKIEADHATIESRGDATRANVDGVIVIQEVVSIPGGGAAYAKAFNDEEDKLRQGRVQTDGYTSLHPDDDVTDSDKSNR